MYRLLPSKMGCSNFEGLTVKIWQTLELDRNNINILNEEGISDPAYALKNHFEFESQVSADNDCIIL